MHAVNTIGGRLLTIALIFGIVADLLIVRTNTAYGALIGDNPSDDRQAQAAVASLRPN
jgi:hypothetical protein